MNQTKVFLQTKTSISSSVPSNNQFTYGGRSDPAAFCVYKQTDEVNGDWVWTFDGAGGCHLSGITTGFESDGSYTLDENGGTVTTKIDSWDEEKVYTYTLNGDVLDLESTYSSYHLVKEQ